MRGFSRGGKKSAFEEASARAQTKARKARRKFSLAARCDVRRARCRFVPRGYWLVGRYILGSVVGLIFCLGVEA